MNKILTLAFLLTASNADAIGISNANQAGQVLLIEDIRPLDNLWSGENFYTDGIFLIDDSVTPSTWQFTAVSGSTVVLRNLDGTGTFYFQITSPPQFGIGVQPDDTANLYVGIIKATDSVFITNNLTVDGTAFINTLEAGTTIAAPAIVTSTLTLDGFQLQSFQEVDLGGIIMPVDDDQGIVVSKTGALSLDAAIGFAIFQDGVIVGFIASVNEGGEQNFYIGESEDPDVGGVIRFRGSAASPFDGDVDILSATAAGSAVHVKMPAHFHVQGEIYVGGVLGVPDSTHGGSNGHTNDLVCIKSDGNFGRMDQSGGTITTGTCL